MSLNNDPTGHGLSSVFIKVYGIDLHRWKLSGVLLPVSLGFPTVFLMKALKYKNAKALVSEKQSV